jgi:hypothetical protein
MLFGQDGLHLARLPTRQQRQQLHQCLIQRFPSHAMKLDATPQAFGVIGGS